MTENVNSFEQTPKMNNESEQSGKLFNEAQDSEVVLKCAQCKYECKKLEGTARYTGLPLAPAEGFSQG